MWRGFYCVIEPRCKLFDTPQLTGEHEYKMQFYVFNFSVCTSDSRHCVPALHCWVEVVAITVHVTPSVLIYSIIFLPLNRTVSMM